MSTPVREHGSDSIESLVWLLTRELMAGGHEVTVFAASGSQVPGKLVETLPGGYGAGGSPDDWQLCEWINLCRAVEQSEQFDVLHTHGYLWGMPLEKLSRAPMLHTFHVTPYDDQARLWAMYPRARVTALSKFQWAKFGQFQPAAIIPHGVDPGQFTFRSQAEDYICYLGRFIPGKGPLAAIELARAIGCKLVLAGPRNEYFAQMIKPHVDGGIVEYAGMVTGSQRDALLGGARALIYPLQVPEPFGLVMAEAMMCGTPVAALGIGAVPEIVDEGVTGYTAENTPALAKKMEDVFRLDRAAVRQQAMQRFSCSRMAMQYLEQYQALLDSAKGGH